MGTQKGVRAHGWSKPTGVIAALPTPFAEDGSLDERSLASLTSWLAGTGIDALMALGGTGEFPHLTREERRRVGEIVLAEAGGRIPVIVGTAACSTRETILLSQDSCRAGADAVIVVPPFYFKLPRHALFQHYQTLTREVDLPIIVYDNPLYTGNPLSPPLIAELMNLPGIVGLKESNSDLAHLAEVLRLTKKLPVSICTGIDSQFLAALLMGAHGIYSTAASIIPGTMCRVYELYKAKELDRACSLCRKLQHLHRFLEYEPGYVAPCKDALRMLGLPGGSVRAPLPELSNRERQELRHALEITGALKNHNATRIVHRPARRKSHR